MAYTSSDKKESVSKELADKITQRSIEQLRTSRQFKRGRMEEIRQNENLYHGIVTPSIRNPFNECFPFMAGFIDHYRSKIDDDSNLTYSYQAEADYKKASRFNGFYERESKDPSSNASWNIKHRHAKVNALFSGVAIYHYYAESSPQYKSCLDVVSHYDFHCEPRGGAILENHLFCGQDNIQKNVEDLALADQYNQTQVALLTTKASENGFKDNDDEDTIRNNRFTALKQDPVTNNYVGQSVIKFVQWYTTYGGKRYYVLFHEASGVWIRCCLLTEFFPDNLYPYVTWHTNEDPDVFWSKAPADDARPVALIINTFINQDLYNRQKVNYGETHYDADMYPNVQALIDSRPDKFVPVDTKGGNRKLQEGIWKVPVGGLNATLDMVTWLEGFTGKHIGYTSSSAGQSEKDKKVGVFEGEIQQVEELIGVKNKSYRDAITHLGLLFKQGVEHNLSKEVAVKVMGAKGVEWQQFGPDDLKTERPLTIEPVGGTSELALKRAKDSEKLVVLESPAMQGVNPQWKAHQMLLLKGFTEEDIKDAFSPDSFAQKELMSEAAEAEREIVEGKLPKLNRGADSNFMQHIIDFATNTNDLTEPQYQTLMKYALAHTDIAIENEARNVREMIRAARLNSAAAAPPEISAPSQSPVIPTSTPLAQPMA
jgi:hypothetical protein